MTARALIVSAPRSGAGKTTVTLGLLAALRRRGTAVRAAKAGPDYIDPAFHAAATGAPSPNLDSWAMPPGLLDALLAQAAGDAETLVIEGAMGLFDGVAGEAGRSGAAAVLAARFGIPVLLVVDVTGQSQSAAAVVAGFAGFDRAPSRTGARRHSARRDARAAGAAFGAGAGGRAWRPGAAARAAGRRGGTALRPRCDLCGGRNTDSSCPGLSRASTPGDRNKDVDGRNKSGHDEQNGTASPRPARRAGVGRGLQFHVCASARGLAAGRGGDHSVIAARRRAAARTLRRLLAAGRLSRAACRRARGGAQIPRRACALRRVPPGAWRVRRLHGAGRIFGGRQRPAPSDDRPARPRHQLRPTPAASRLSGGAPPCRQSDRRRRRVRAGARVSSRVTADAGRRRAA